MLGPDLGLPLSVLGIEKMDGVAVGDEQFARVLYRQQAFLAGDELNQCLGKRRLAGTRRAGDQDILARLHSQFQKGGPFPALLEGETLQIGGRGSSSEEGGAGKD